MKKVFLRMLFMFFIVFASAVFFLSYAKTSERGPSNYSPGFQELSLRFSHRDVEVPLFVWYPSSEEISPELIGQNALFYGHYVRANALPNEGLHPVVVFSHGSGGNALQIGWLAEALAANGFVVLAMNHPGTTSRDSLPERTVMIWERANDLRELLDWIEETNELGISLDSNRIAMAGFSLGGHSALSISGLRVSKANFIEYCDRNAETWDCGWLSRGGVDFSAINADLYDADYGDPRVKSTIAIDPALMPATILDSAKAISHPVMVINFEPDDGIPEALDASGVVHAMPNARYETIERSWHFSFLPECSLLGKIVIGLSGEENICSDQGLQDRADVHQRLIEKVIPFLHEHL